MYKWEKVYYLIIRISFPFFSIEKRKKKKRKIELNQIYLLFWNNFKENNSKKTKKKEIEKKEEEKEAKREEYSVDSISYITTLVNSLKEKNLVLFFI